MNKNKTVFKDAASQTKKASLDIVSKTKLKKIAGLREYVLLFQYFSGLL